MSTLRAPSLLLGAGMMLSLSALAQGVDSLSDEEVAGQAVALSHGVSLLGGSDSQALVDRVRAAPLTYIPLLSPYASVAFIRANADRPSELRKAASAISLLFVACGPAGADEAEARIIALMSERDAARLALGSMVGSLDATSTADQVEAARARYELLGVYTLVEKQMIRATMGARDPRFKDVLTSRLTTQPDLAWVYADYLDAIAPDDLAVSEAMHQAFLSTESPTLRARLEPRVTAYLASLTPPRYGDHGFVWANEPSSASYAPSSYYALNSTGGAVTLSRNGVGAYSVRFHGLGGSGGNVQVTAYGADDRSCKVGGWGGSPDLSITVYCYASSGARADTRYTVLFYRESLDHAPENAGSTAYLWAQSATQSSFDASPYYSYNDTGGVNTIVRVGAGQYDAHLPGASATGTPQVTAYGSDAVRCRPSGWWSADGGTTVRVVCHTAAGAVADSRFTLSFVSGRVPGLRPSGEMNRGAYAWANDPTSASYIASATYQDNTLHADRTPLTVRRTGIGSYEVDVPRDVGVGAADTVQINAYGGSGAHCKVAWWSRMTSATRVGVRCFSASGALADNRFAMLYVTDADW